jgi:hypothetical protein
MSGETKPAFVPADVDPETWVNAAEAMASVGWYATSMIRGAYIAIMAAKAEAHRDLVDCLDDMTKHYVELAGSGDCGFWNPEREMEVIAARKMVAEHRAGDVNAAHTKNNSEA